MNNNEVLHTITISQKPDHPYTTRKHLKEIPTVPRNTWKQDRTQETYWKHALKRRAPISANQVTPNSSWQFTFTVEICIKVCAYRYRFLANTEKPSSGDNIRAVLNLKKNKHGLQRPFSRSLDIRTSKNTASKL